MDPLTHCLVGGLAAKTVKTSKRRFWIMMILGMVPDLDVVFSLFGSWAFWLQHRGISHSILGLVFQSIFYAAVLGRWDSGPFRTRALQYSLPLGLHIFCDYLTSFGVPLLSPFSFIDFSADLMVGLALVPIVFMTVGLFWLHHKGSVGWGAVRPLWAGWLLYVFMAASGKAYAFKLIDQAQGPTTTLPSTANIFVWSAIHHDHAGQAYRRYEIDLVKGRAKPTQVFFSPENSFPINSSMSSPIVKEFLEKTRWPVARVINRPDGWEVEWGQLLFSTRGVVRGKIALQINTKGQIESEKKIFKFWNPPASASSS